jgi:hypothetical protein
MFGLLEKLISQQNYFTGGINVSYTKQKENKLRGLSSRATAAWWRS